MLVKNAVSKSYASLNSSDISKVVGWAERVVDSNHVSEHSNTGT